MGPEDDDDEMVRMRVQMLSLDSYSLLARMHRQHTAERTAHMLLNQYPQAIRIYSARLKAIEILLDARTN